MEGIWFYWISWISWVVVTFFLKKDRVRLQLATIILILIIAAHYIVSFNQINVSAGFIIMFIMVYMFVSVIPNQRLIYFFICTIILSFAFVSFYLFKLFDPVWVVFEPTIMLAFILIYLVFLLEKGMKNRILLFIFGSTHGELLYAAVMNHFSFPHVMGSLSFFDALAVGLLFITLLKAFERLSAYFQQHTQKTNKRREGIS